MELLFEIAKEFIKEKNTWNEFINVVWNIKYNDRKSFNEFIGKIIWFKNVLHFKVN